MKLVTVKVFNNIIEAQIMKSKLESENVYCFLFDENIVGIDPLYNISIGGIKLKVRQSDFDIASEIIEESNNLLFTNDEVMKCPVCKSKDIYSGFNSMEKTKGVLSAVISFFFMVFPFYIDKVYKCKSCEHEFK